MHPERTIQFNLLSLWYPCVVFGSLFLSLTPLMAQTRSGEYDVKAAILEKFTDYVQWPDEKMASQKSCPFVIAVLGRNPFGSSLDRVYKHKKIGDRVLIVRYVKDVQTVKDVDILFITSSERKKIDQILDVTCHYPVLTIGDSEGYAEKGVMINLFLQSNQIHFNINKAAATKSGIKINYRLLNLAIHVFSDWERVCSED